MPSPLDKLEPRLIWKHFDAIRQIPRPSKHEERVAQHVVGWARGKGLEVARDAAGNVIVRVPASAGHEKAPVVVLQGHLDMVPEKNSDVEFDFDKDPIQVRVVDDFVYATGTTLGSDNGIGVAAAMAVADDPGVVHGPLELLFTVDEETGLTGAMQLDASLIRGKTLLNLDTEEEGALYIGCAGGADTHATFAIARKDTRAGTMALKIAVRGLRGGHSGVDIHENRGNALRFLLRALNAVREHGLRFALVSIEGGSKHNAIPREADAVIRIAPHNEASLRVVVEGVGKLLKEEYHEIDANGRIEVTRVADSAKNRQVWRPGDANRVINALLAVPHGVLAMSRAVPGLVETSNNLAVVITEPDKVRVTTSSRSSVMPSLKATTEQLAAIFRLGAAKVELHDGYPGWKPNPGSPVLKTVERVYQREFGAKPVVKAIHAGLECGLLGERCPGMDMVSLGPQIESPHSPDERVKISSVGKFYQLLKATLKELA
ncbi:MAG TPA: aminoacyl-histidine dipeptidase [Thermoanaerobaculaceae bacterium]|nr:aminoacyl-histidine dipeptidase [Thermoanaerobaculaceae bacterium]